MTKDFLDLQHTIGMVAYQANIVLVWNRCCSYCDEAIAGGVASFDTVPELVGIDALLA